VSRAGRFEAPEQEFRPRFDQLPDRLDIRFAVLLFQVIESPVINQQVKGSIHVLQTGEIVNV
jgi:hypothetical protein